jgi:hypothetical protein
LLIGHSGGSTTALEVEIEGLEGGNRMALEAEGPLERLGPRNPLRFARAGEARTVILNNAGLQATTFENGAAGTPGVLTVNPGGNFTISRTAGQYECLDMLGGQMACRVNFTSREAGRRGEYELRYGSAGSTYSTGFRLES